MKGYEITIEQLGAVLLLIIIVAFAFYFIFKEKIERVPPPTIEALAKCTKHIDCDGNSRGTLCMSLNSAAYDCGCLTASDCSPPPGKTASCIENVCVIA